MIQTDNTARHTEAILLLKQLIAIRSYSGEEDQTALLLESFLKSRDVAAMRHLNNVWATNKHFDAAKPTILLNSHHDTVRASSLYTNNPFEAIERDGKVYGLGSNDAGGCLVALMAAFLHFYGRENLNYNLVFAASAEEEISGPNGITSLLQVLPAITCAIVGEPTEMNMAVAEKGLLVLDCTSHGKSGHAANNEGENAIYSAIKDIEWFKNYSFPKVSDLLGPVKMTVTMVRAGSQHNVVPDKCSYTVDCRINECYSHEDTLAIIRQNVTSDVNPRSRRLRSTAIALDHPLVLAGLDLNKKIYGSPTLSDKALMPFPALKMGPGLSARSHMADEYIFVAEVKDGIDTYIQLLNELL